MGDAPTRLSPSDAVRRARTYFDDFHKADGRDFELSHLMLDGLEYDDETNVWRVTIGFDAGRRKKVVGPLTMYRDIEEPVRQINVIELDADTGDFRRLYN